MISIYILSIRFCLKLLWSKIHCSASWPSLPVILYSLMPPYIILSEFEVEDLYFECLPEPSRPHVAFAVTWFKFSTSMSMSVRYCNVCSVIFLKRSWRGTHFPNRKFSGFGTKKDHSENVFFAVLSWYSISYHIHFIYQKCISAAAYDRK